MPSGVARNAEGVRWDHLFIVDVVPPGVRVLDLGCGKGILLKMLIDAKKVRGTGIEIVEDKVYEAVAKGVTVYHGDFDEGLSYYPDNSFDYVILSQTLQEARETVAVLQEALRVGHFVVASFPNFGHWKARLQLLFTGKAPVTELASLPVVQHAEHPLLDHQGLPGLHAGAGDQDRPPLLRGAEAASALLAEPSRRLRGVRAGEAAVGRARRRRPTAEFARRRVDAVG